MNRRRFLKTTSCALCGAAFAGTSVFLESCKKNKVSVPFTLDLTQSANASLNTSGGSVVSNGVIVVNTGGSFIAVTQRCTHSSCNVAYNQSSDNFVCPCHGGTFDINGNVISGPPPSPLKNYTVSRSGNILTISG